MRAVINFIGERQPDEVVHIGDLMDYPQPSRWTKDTAAEFQGSVFRDSESAKRRFCEPLRAVYEGPVGIIEGNHDLRPRQYLSKYAPALAESNAFDFATLLDFDGFGFTKLPEFYRFNPSWVMTHGHRGGISLSQISGQTARLAASSMDSSIIMGHTHRLGKQMLTRGYGGEMKHVLTGLEVGNLMSMKQAQYLEGATANWQQGFGVVYVDGNHVNAQPIPITHRKFIVDGTTYHV